MLANSFWTASAVVLSIVSVSSALSETERQEGFFARGYTWPPAKYVPDTAGWRHRMEERLEQVHEIDDLDRRYEGYMQVSIGCLTTTCGILALANFKISSFKTINPALVAPNFTEWGFGLTRAPEPLMQELRDAIKEGLARGEARSEGKVEVIDGPENPLFIDRPELMNRVLHELHPYVEAWAGIEVIPYTAYGLRLYQNQSAVWMHVDKAQVILRR